jgi:hypothetical protein
MASTVVLFVIAAFLSGAVTAAVAPAPTDDQIDQAIGRTRWLYPAISPDRHQC